MHAAEWDVQEARGGVVAPLELAGPAADTKGPKAAFAEHAHLKSTAPAAAGGVLRDGGAIPDSQDFSASCPATNQPAIDQTFPSAAQGL